MDNALFIQPLIAGLSVGAFCLTYCLPFMAPFVAAEERPFRSNVLLILEFLLGRLIGYLFFGFLAGFLGEKLDFVWSRFATNLSFIFLSGVLVFYLLGIHRPRELSCKSPRFFRTQSALAMGFLMGINICPPFLLSVIFVFSQKSALYGIAYFALFFLASSVYFLPVLFLGILAKAKAFQKVARWSGFLTAIIFFSYGIYSLFKM